MGAMEAMADTVLVTPLAMVLATAMAAMARGQMGQKPMPTMAMEAMVDTVLDTPLATVLAMDGGYGKRSADSEADAYYGYGGYGGYGLGYGGYGYGGLGYGYGK